MPHERRSRPMTRLSILALIPWWCVAAVAAADSVTVSADSVAMPVRSDTLGAGSVPMRRGVADTVTMLPPVKVEGRGGLVPDRSTATQVRLNRAEVTRFLPGTSTDALLVVPGVDLIKTGPWASRVSYHGLSGERVLVLVDGVRVNTVRGHGAQASLVPLDQLDGVELLPGATSAQFGSDALGGVINLVTHRPLFAPVPSLGVTMMAHGADPGEAWGQSVRLAYRAPVWGFELSGGLGGLDALVTPDGRVPHSGNREDHVAGRVLARAGGFQFDLEHARQAAHDVGLPAFGNAAGAAGTYPLQARDATRLETAWSGRGPIRLARVLTVHQRFETRFDETTVDSVFFRGRLLATRTNEAADRVTSPAFSVAPELRLAGFGHARLMGEWRREETRGPRETREIVRNAAGETTSDTLSLGESIPPARRDVWAFSAFVSQSVAGFRFEAGARRDVLRSRADSTANSSTSRLDVTDRRTSVEGGVSRRLAAFEPYVHAATGFRAPNLQERYYNDEIHGGLRLFGNPDLRAERSESYQAGLRATEAWGGRLRSLRISAYRSDVRDLISLLYLGQLYQVPRFQYANVERARIEGVELMSQLQLGRLRVGLTAGVPRGVNRMTGEKLVDAGSARVTLDLSVPLRGLPYGRLSTRLRWSDAITGVDTTFARPAFTNVAVEASTILAGTMMTFAVRNLLDHGYREPLSFIPEPGRTFAVSLRRDFVLPLKRNTEEP